MGSFRGRERPKTWGILHGKCNNVFYQVSFRQPVHGVEQIAHGMGERYLGLIDALVSVGFTVYGNDHRGHGRTAPSPAHLGDFGDEKQLYSSHYFETALDLTYCVSGDDPKQPGFYLIMFMGSEQAGLTGFKGSIVRKVAVGRSASSLQKSLTSIRETLEKNQ